jgi:hypothetical protein
MPLKLLIPLAAALALGAGTAMADDDRADHYGGEPAPTLAAALGNLAEYNQRLATLLQSPTLAPADLHEVHRLTYTLENALQRLDDELEGMAESLEAVHLASEAQDEATVRTQGRAYLESSGRLLE